MKVLQQLAARRTLSNPKFRRNFYKKLATLITNSIRLETAFNTLYQQALKDNQKVHLFYRDVLQSISAGQSLSKSLQTWINPGEVMIIAAGEQGGQLSQVLLSVEKNIIAQTRIIKTIRSALAYPIFMLLAAIGVLCFIGGNVLPQISSMSDPVSWQGMAASLHQVSTFLAHGGAALVIGLLVVLGLLIRHTLDYSWGKSILRDKVDNIPPWSFYRILQGSNFMLGLSVMLKSGTRIQKALDIMNQYGSNWLKIRLKVLNQAIDGGAPHLGVAMDRSPYVFPNKIVISDMVIYGDQKKFEQILQDYGQAMIEETLESVEASASKLRALGTVTLVMVIGWIIFGILGVQQEISNSAQF